MDFNTESSSMVPPKAPIAGEIENFAPGIRFFPTDEELISHYLKQRTQGVLTNLIPDVDIYKFQPCILPMSEKKSVGREWYFFSLIDKYGHGTKLKRCTESGFWKASGSSKPVLDGSQNTIGTKRLLVFYLKGYPEDTKTDWIMHEFRIVNEEEEKTATPQKKKEFVLCRIFQKGCFSALSNWIPKDLNDTKSSQGGVDSEIDQQITIAMNASPLQENVREVTPLRISSPPHPIEDSQLPPNNSIDSKLKRPCGSSKSAAYPELLSTQVSKKRKTDSNNSYANNAFMHASSQGSWSSEEPCENSASASVVAKTSNVPSFQIKYALPVAKPVENQECPMDQQVTTAFPMMNYAEQAYYMRLHAWERESMRHDIWKNQEMIKTLQSELNYWKEETEKLKRRMDAGGHSVAPNK